MDAARVDHVRLGHLQACVESACRALIIGRKDAAAGNLALAARWYARAESSLAFAGALATFLRSRRCIVRRPLTTGKQPPRLGNAFPDMAKGGD